MTGDLLLRHAARRRACCRSASPEAGAHGQGDAAMSERQRTMTVHASRETQASPVTGFRLARPVGRRPTRPLHQDGSFDSGGYRQDRRDGSPRIAADRGSSRSISAAPGEPRLGFTTISCAILSGSSAKKPELSSPHQPRPARTARLSGAPWRATTLLRARGGLTPRSVE